MIAMALKAQKTEIQLATRTFRVAPAELGNSLGGLLAPKAMVVGWSATSVVIGQCVDGKIVDSHGHSVASDSLYALRAFDGTHDVRWSLRNGAGTLVQIGERSDSTPADAVFEKVSAVITGVRYLLFGERDEESGGWVTLSAANVGVIHVPDPGGKGRVAIEAVEYVVFDNDGNADVIDERLVRLVEGTVGQ